MVIAPVLLSSIRAIFLLDYLFLLNCILILCNVLIYYSLFNYFLVNISCYLTYYVPLLNFSNMRLLHVSIL